MVYHEYSHYTSPKAGLNVNGENAGLILCIFINTNMPSASGINSQGKSRASEYIRI